MIGDIDLSLKSDMPEVFLCKSDRTTIAKVTSRSGIAHSRYGKRRHLLSHTQKLKLGNINEIAFSMPYMVEIRHKLVRNPIIDLVLDRYLLRVERSVGTEWYTISSIEDSMDGTKDIKTVTAYSLGYQLKDKIINNFHVIGQNLTAIMNGGTTVDDSGNVVSFKGLLSNTTWSLGSVDASLDTTYREINITSSKTLLDVLLSDVSATFNTVIEFDTVNEKINFKVLDDYSVNKGFKVSYGKFMKSVDSKYDADQLVTHLRPLGKDGLTIKSVNATGSEYLEDFSFFMAGFQEDSNGNVIGHSKYMSDGLCKAIKYYNQKVKDNSGTYKNYLTQLSNLQSQLTTQQNALDDTNMQITTVQDEISVAQAANTDTSSLQGQLSSLQSTQVTQQNAVNDTQSQINTVNANIQSLQQTIAIENNFTPEQIKERNYYIIEKDLTDTRFTDAQSLYNYATVKFNEMNVPALTVTTDIVNFLECITEQREWDKLTLGDIVTVEHENIGINVRARLMEISFDHEQGNIQITIGTTKDLKRNKELITTAISAALSTSADVDMAKYKWDTVSNVQSDVNSILNNAWDASKRAIIGASNESVIIDGRGITVTNPSSQDNKYLRIAHGIIGMTQDGGNTFQLAIDPSGIYAQRLIGQIVAGTNLTITNSGGTFTVNETGVTISGTALTITNGLPESQINSSSTTKWNSAESNANAYTDTQISEVNASINTLQSDINNSMSDSYITNIEANTLKVDLAQLQSESTDLINIATALGITTEKSDYSNALSDLQTELNKWIDQPSYPISITSTDRSNIQSKMSATQDKKSILINKISSVREANATAVANTAQQSADNAQSSANTANSLLSDIASDSKLTPSEKQSTKKEWDTIVTEKPTIDAQATTYGITTEKVDFDNTYDSLNTYITPLLSDLTITSDIVGDTFRSNFKNYYDKRQILLKKISDLAKSLADAAQATANNSVQQGTVYNGVKIDTTNGIVVTRSDNKAKLLMNATDGIKIQTSADSGTTWTDKFYVDTNGALIAESLTANKIIIKNGGQTLIDASTGTINFDSFTTKVGKLTADNIDATNLTVSSLNVTGTLSAPQLDLNNNLKGTNVANNFVIDSAGNVTFKGTITGGSITSNTTINVTTDATIGNSLILNQNTLSGGIRWGTAANAPAIYLDPGAGSINLHTNTGGIYANGYRIDQAPVAVFG